MRRTRIYYHKINDPFEYSYKEVAQALGLSVAQVINAEKSALKKLSALLEFASD